MLSPDQDDLIFKALSAATRRAILDSIRDRPQTTGELCAGFPALDRCTVMQHLGVLERADLGASAGTTSTRCRSRRSTTAGSAPTPPAPSPCSTG